MAYCITPQNMEYGSRPVPAWLMWQLNRILQNPSFVLFPLCHVWWLVSSSGLSFLRHKRAALTTRQHMFTRHDGDQRQWRRELFLDPLFEDFMPISKHTQKKTEQNEDPHFPIN